MKLRNIATKSIGMKILGAIRMSHGVEDHQMKWNGLEPSHSAIIQSTPVVLRNEADARELADQDYKHWNHTRKRSIGLLEPCSECIVEGECTPYHDSFFALKSNVSSVLKPTNKSKSATMFPVMKMLSFNLANLYVKSHEYLSGVKDKSRRHQCRLRQKYISTVNGMVSLAYSTMSEHLSTQLLPRYQFGDITLETLITRNADSKWF